MTSKEACFSRTIYIYIYLFLVELPPFGVVFICAKVVIIPFLVRLAPSQWFPKGLSLDQKQLLVTWPESSPPIRPDEVTWRLFCHPIGWEKQYWFLGGFLHTIGKERVVPKIYQKIYLLPKIPFLPTIGRRPQRGTLQLELYIYIYI